MRIEYHRTMLADRVRNVAFYEALKRSIVPGKSIVADIGSGTGVLGFMASKLGAKKVYLLEKAEIAHVAKKLAKHNGIRNIELVPAHSTEVEPPQRCHIVVSETLGNYAFEENIIETLADARARYLEPDGIVIPGQVEQFVSPVIEPRYHAELSTWDDVGFDLDFEPAKTMGFNNIYVRTFKPADLLDGGKSAVLWDAADFHKSPRTNRAGNARFAVKSASVVHGLALWWAIELVPGVRLATGPFDPKTHWEQLYLPAKSALRIPAGGTLAVRIRSTTSYAEGTNVTWTLTALDAKDRELDRQHLDLNKGFVP